LVGVIKDQLEKMHCPHIEKYNWKFLVGVCEEITKPSSGNKVNTGKQPFCITVLLSIKITLDHSSKTSFCLLSPYPSDPGEPESL
jgi:hypothetical protein